MTTLSVTEQEVGPYMMVYVPFTGKSINVRHSVDVVKTALSGKNIEYINAVWIFEYWYNSGKITLLEKNWGSVIDVKNLPKLDKTSSIYHIKQLLIWYKPVIIFPYKSSFSYTVWHIRSIAKLHKYIQSKAYTNASIIEIFNKEQSTIYYIALPQK